MKSQKLIVLNREYHGTVEEIDPSKLDITSITPIQLLHEIIMAERRRIRAKAPDVFSMTTVNDVELFDDIPKGELEAERVVTHKRLVITDKKLRVIHGHEAVLKAFNNAEEKLIIFRVEESLSKKEITYIQTRYASKESLLSPAPRIEVIRLLHDEYSLPLEQIQALLVGSRGAMPSRKEVTSELRVGRLFEKYPGYKIPFTAFELDKHAFSNLKYLVGTNKIFKRMEADQQIEVHFLNMAINQTKKKTKRLNTVIPPILKYEETELALISQGLDQAEALLKAKYPEENKGNHPHYDIVAANAKMSRPENMVMLKKQLEDRSRIHPTSLELNELVASFSVLSSFVCSDLLHTINKIAPEQLVDFVLANNSELLFERISLRQSELSKISNKDMQ